MRTLHDLRSCRSIRALRAELYDLCRPFGSIKRLDVLQSKHEGARQAICFLRMGTPSQEVAMMHALGIGRFGGEMVFVVDLDDQVASASVASSGPSSEWADWAES